VKARQTNKNWITHKQMLAATLSTPMVFIANERMRHLCFCHNFSGPDSLNFYCTTWCPDTCKENFVSAAIPKKALLNERPWAFETAFFVRGAITAFVICLNTKKERVIKAHWWLDLRVALYSRIKILKARTYFQICQNNSGPYCKCCFAQSDMLEKILAKFVNRIT